MIKPDNCSPPSTDARPGEKGRAAARRRYEAPVITTFGRKLPAFAPPSEPGMPGMPPPRRG